MVGVFAARSKPGPGIDLVSSMPDPEICCVTTWGTGYLVNVRDPNLWRAIDTYPVLGANAIVDLQLLVRDRFYQPSSLWSRRSQMAGECAMLGRTKG